MKEYGGYLPLELNSRGGYFDSYSRHLVALKCGRTAMEYILKDAVIEHLYLPRYLCPSVADYLKNKVSIVFYNINENFDPVDVKLGSRDYLLWVNFFGLASISQQKLILQRYKNVIFDNTQAFYAKPIMSTYNIYSCRKFFGVVDGAYLIREDISHWPLEKNYGYGSGEFLFKSLEKGTNAAYLEYLNNEDKFKESGLKEMSLLSQKIMQNVDFEGTAERRRNNFSMMHAQLKGINELDIYLYEETVPMVYPLLVTNSNLRQYLIQNKVYVPQWWKYVLEDKESNLFEKRLSEWLLPLPIDQRYVEEDIYSIAELVKMGYNSGNS